MLPEMKVLRSWNRSQLDQVPHGQPACPPERTRKCGQGTGFTISGAKKWMKTTESAEVDLVFCRHDVTIRNLMEVHLACHSASLACPHAIAMHWISMSFGGFFLYERA
jgi:hypothetical protein